jgi:hypothetical protein
MDLTGRKVAGGELVTIRLHPGVGVTGPNGEHMEGGPHEVPAHFAYPIVRTNRAVVIEGAPAGVEHRDPTPETREGRRRR